ncbi:MAG: efflux RND transporter periplasmic adaptor subunit [Mariniphaga sp.]
MKQQSIFLIGALIIGIFIGWLFFHSSGIKEETHNHSTEGEKAAIWTCAMHPQIRMSEPGKCPICAMQLVPLSRSGNSIDPDAILMTKEAVQLANVLTSSVSKQSVVKELRLYGKVQTDERLLQSQVSHLPGRIEKLLVNFTGEVVRKGQTLAVIYSPDLLIAQQELLETVATKQSQPVLYEAAKDKLRQWKLTDQQIALIENSGKVKTEFEVYANTSGIVSARRVNTGDYISPGTVLFDIADLSQVWIMFDAYESDLPYLSKGHEIKFSIQALPGTNYSGRIAFIDPVLDPNTRIARVRIEIDNKGGKFKPEMFATGIVKADLAEYKNNLIIPRSAVLWTGKRSVVYVKQIKTSEPVFKLREVELGPLLGISYVVMSGLSEGEEIVTQGAFSVDASAQLDGKPSMMNQEPRNPSGNVDAMKMIVENPAEKSSARTQFIVVGTCDLCKERIEIAAKSVSGVISAVWNANEKILITQYDATKANPMAIQKAVADAGHDTENFKAPADVYNQLPKCCLYRK